MKPGEGAGAGEAPAPVPVIVTGNEKGGSGKSTVAMHLIVGLMQQGWRVGCIDLDAGQWTLSHYLTNREESVSRDGLPLAIPKHAAPEPSTNPLRPEAEAEDRAALASLIAEMGRECDILVIDCPGGQSFLGRAALSHADRLVTPINDSFVDLDLLADVDGETLAVRRPSRFAETIWEQRKERARRDGGSIDWIVMRNRLSNITARNKSRMAGALDDLAGRIGFRVAPGFSERVIYRELFLCGLTVLDIFETAGAAPGAGATPPSLSHVAARQEVRTLLAALDLPPRKV